MFNGLYFAPILPSCLPVPEDYGFTGANIKLVSGAEPINLKILFYLNEQKTQIYSMVENNNKT